MKSRTSGDDKRKLNLISLMDVVFILLIFFLVSVFFASLPNEERKLFIPTPKNEAGSAQVLIQLIDDESYFYIDPLMTESLVNDIAAIDRGGLSTSAKLAAKKNLLMRRCKFKMDDPQNNLFDKLAKLVDHANTHPEEEYFVIIRCPGNLPYSKVIDVIQVLANSTYQNIQYGCVGGTIDDIRNSSRIEMFTVREEGQLRKNVVIDL